MGRTPCTELQCLYKGALYLYLYLHLIFDKYFLEIRTVCEIMGKNVLRPFMPQMAVQYGA